MPVVTLTKSNSVVKDCRLDSQNPTINDNGSTIGLGNSSGVIRRTQLFFDLGLIPNNAIINSAVLNFNINAGPSVPLTADVYPLTADWVETAPTWNSPTSYDSTRKVSSPIAAGTGTRTIDVKALVQDMVDGLYPNRGFLIKSADESVLGTGVGFDSFNSAGIPPTLTIDYTIPTTGKKQVEVIAVANASGASATTYSPTIPVSAQPGDLIAVLLTSGSNTAVTASAGWTKQYEVISGSNTESLFAKIIGSGEAAPVFSSSVARTWNATSMVFRNAKSVLTTSRQAITSGVSYTPSPSGASVSSTKSLYVLLNTAAGGTTFTPPLSYIELQDTAAGLWQHEIAYRYMHDKLTQTGAEMTSAASVSTNGFSGLIVLEPLTNNPPTITLTSPTDNLSLAEGSTFPIAGEASDADNGNVVTVKYKINNGTARAIASGVSDGSSPLSFAKTLTYSNKRLWDGAVDVTGADLAENVDHVLTVWAEDDQGGKSEEVTRKFRVIWNRPPTISGENGDLGIMEEPPSVEYTVTDPETNPFTITEKINGEVIRTFAGVAGQQETITIPHELWIRLEPGVQHALTIEASDDQGMMSTRTYTLTRFVDKIVFSMDYATMSPETKDFFTTDVAAKRLLLTPSWDLPPGAVLQVEVCNNAYDEDPSWEDATIVVKLNRAHLFANETKTADKWGINFRVRIEKGTATQPVYLKGIGGAFD
ncbi:DNRLRE domain-containing protein [Brevibacillus parabrevis]|uniref:DNRLRE domain-containing protein n=1 Tax=Brevibacillus TaxID=55080 RepID=UPI00257D3A00|nr:DNRLRE domain-containing protein [Brevibacillus sp.]